jgi:hypothetical protein
LQRFEFVGLDAGLCSQFWLFFPEESASLVLGQKWPFELELGFVWAELGVNSARFFEC